jgi:4-amino-4-deoxy-L-arabinose transferase-like glycosyltransferase
MILKIEKDTGRLLGWTLAIVALLRLLTLGLYPLTDTTEARYAEVARKMAELNDWITPWYDYGIPFWAKPPLSTWLTAASLKLFGVNEFAARLPYFLLAVLIAWLVWDWARRWSRREALLAIAVMSGTMLYFIASAAVMTDMALVLGTTLAMRGFWAPFERADAPRPKEGWLLFVGLGIGLLAKGPIALVLAGIPIFLWTVFTGNIVNVWKRLPWIRGVILMLLIAVPWYWLAEQRTPGFWEYFFIGEHWKRFTVTGWAGDKYGTAHATARGAIWLLALAACLPWTILLPVLAIGRKKALASAGVSPSLAVQPSQKNWRLYLLAWAIAPCLFFTMSGNILWTYVLPALPALALLAAGWLAGDVRTRWVDSIVSAGVIVMALLIAAYFLNEQRMDSWKSAKKAVAEYKLRNSDARPLLFMGDLPYSASFYTGGKARAQPDGSALEKKLGQERAFVALRPDQLEALPPDLKARLRLEVKCGIYNLYSMP